MRVLVLACIAALTSVSVFAQPYDGRSGSLDVEPPRIDQAIEVDGLDDHVLIFLSTYNDGRQAFVFGVNPLGVQLDGALAEGTRGGGTTSGREGPDYNPDYLFQSKGRVTAVGYEVEVRIPFKSLRYQSQPKQDWGIHVTRVAPQQGIEDSWAPAKRNAASFLSQSGRLRNLTDLRRGLVLDINPIGTTKLDGQSQANGWGYDASRPEFGMNLRWGVTPNLTLNGTVNPDFSQVESDAGQFSFDPRQALFFPEKASLLSRRH